MRLILWVLLIIGVGFVSYFVSKETRRQECAKCQEWMEENPGLWLRDPCEDLCNF
jgi:hypothetical protein